MKKITALVLACLMAFGMTAVCGAEAHTHTPSAEWDRDPKAHWHACECGERLDEEAHTMEDILCTVCGSEIWAFEDGLTDINTYNERGDLIRNTFYDAEGVATDDYFYIYEYDADDNLLRSQTFFFDMLVEEMEYAESLTGEYLVRLQTGYSEDGSKSVNEYDGYGNIVKAVSYGPEGTVEVEETTEYDYDEEGIPAETRRTVRFADGAGYVSIDNQYGDQVKCVFYNADGSVEFESRTEYEYDENGIRLTAKNYEDDRLVYESVYTVMEDEYGSWSYESLYTEYFENGGKLVYEFDEYGNNGKTTEYDAEGAVVEEIHYDEAGNEIVPEAE